MTDHKDDLLPCPFCGGEAEFIGSLPKNGYDRVSCMGCFVEVEGNNKAEAISAWNTRADLAQSTIKAAEAAALRKAADQVENDWFEPIVFFDKGVKVALETANANILSLIDDQQSSALGAYVKAKVDEALERAATLAGYFGAIQDPRDGSYAGSEPVMGPDIAAAIRAMKETK